MYKLTEKQVQRMRIRCGERGFTLLQLMIVISIVGVLSALALVGMTSARTKERRINSARLFASYMERARVDSVRRRAEGADRASVTITSATSYTVFLDFNSTGTPIARTIALESGIRFLDSDVGAVVSFDWRGRTGGDRGFLIVNNDIPAGNLTDRNYVTPVAVSGFGDVTINDGVYTPSVNSSSSNFNAPTPPPTPTLIPTPTATPVTTPTPSPTPAGGSGQCQIKVYPSANVDVKKNSSTQVAIYFQNATTSIPVTATSSNANEVSVSPGSATIPLGGYAVFTISSLRNNAGFAYDVTFSSSACGNVTVRASVIN